MDQEVKPLTHGVGTGRFAVTLFFKASIQKSQV
jgi:hypothetical protein